MPPPEPATLTRQQNTRYMLRQWLLPGIAALVVALFLGYQLLQGETLPVVVALALLALAGGWTVVAPPVQESRLLQSAAPEPLLAYFDRKLAQAPIADRDAALAFSRALVNTLYGRFDAARAEADRLDWASRPPLIQAQKIFLQAWWAYLDPHDFARGLALARQARDLAEVALAFPGAGLSLSAYDAAVELGQLLTGGAAAGAGAEAPAHLEGRLRRQPALLKALLAWGLASYYQRAGPPEAAARLRHLLARIAPHCADQ